MLGNLDFEIQEIFACGIRNPVLLNPEYSSSNIILGDPSEDEVLWNPTND